MGVKAQSIHNQEAINEFWKVTFKQRLLPLYAILLALLAIEMILISGIIAALICLIIMTIILAIVFKIGMSYNFKNLWKFQNLHNYFLFRDNDYTCSSHTPGGEYQGQSVYNYSIIYRAVETTNYLVLYINKTQAHIIDKRTIVDGTIDDIRFKLMPLLGNKYKI